GDPRIRGARDVEEDAVIALLRALREHRLVAAGLQHGIFHDYRIIGRAEQTRPYVPPLVRLLRRHARVAEPAADLPGELGKAHVLRERAGLARDGRTSLEDGGADRARRGAVHPLAHALGRQAADRTGRPGAAAGDDLAGGADHWRLPRLI